MGTVTKWIVTLLFICIFTSNLTLGNSERKDHISRDSPNKNCRVLQEHLQRHITKNKNYPKKTGAAVTLNILYGMKKIADRKCKGIKECFTKKHDCDKNAICKDTALAFSCTCKPGYKGDGLKCIAMDECVKAGDVCPPALHCLKQGDGSYACACDAKGFKVIGKGDARTCAAMDECVKTGDVCPSALHCLKQGDGSYACACDAKGFKVAGKGDGRTCAATDECVKAGDVCPSALHCVKQGDGSYACACDAKGFKVVGEGDARTCADIDECKEKKFSCSVDRVCKNRPGGYECVCKKGLNLDHDGKCVPLTKCDKKGLSCPRYSNCKKLPSGSYYCACMKGFEEVKEQEKLKRCEDINECLTPEVNCFGDRCRNTPGSFNCVPCLPGFAANDEGFCVAIVKGVCNCDEKTEECRRGKCRCKSALGFRRDNMGRCVRLSGSTLTARPPSSSSSNVYSHVTVLITAFLGSLTLTAWSFN